MEFAQSRSQAPFLTTIMMSFAAFTAILSLTASASPLSLSVRDKPSDVDCISAGKYIGIRSPGFVYYPYCNLLSGACIQYPSQDTFDASKGIWAESVCVAAATCDGINGLDTLAKCYNDETANMDRMPDLDYNVRLFPTLLFPLPC